jgi:hypothetical protein
MVQATVESWDPATGAVMCLDDGTRVTCSPEAVVRGGWRMLRSGQRVALVVRGMADDGQVPVVHSVEMLAGP